MLFTAHFVYVSEVLPKELPKAIFLSVSDISNSFAWVLRRNDQVTSLVLRSALDRPSNSAHLDNFQFSPFSSDNASRGVPVVQLTIWIGEANGESSFLKIPSSSRSQFYSRKRRRPISTAHCITKVISQRRK